MKILRLFSALQPVKLDNSSLLKNISEFVGLDEYQVNLIVSDLESAGVLLKKRNTEFRITPDVFSDYILSDVCVRNGRLTSYANLVFEKFYNFSPINIISNIAEMNWRVQSDGIKIDVMNNVWEKLYNDFNEGSNLERCKILDIVKRIAVFQPLKSLDFICYALDNPSSENDYIFSIEFTHDNVKSAIPEILREISYNLKCLPKCCDILWSLGKDKEGNLSSETDHPIRILQDIAQYNYYKPLVVHEKILDAVKNWLEDPECHNHIHSPFDIIDPILKKDWTDHRLTGRKIEIRSFIVNYKKTKKNREKAILLISSALANKSTRVYLRAINSLTKVLSPPRKLSKKEITDKEYSQWFSEEKDILDIFERFVDKTSDPIIKIELKQNLHRYAKYGRDERNREKSKVIIKKLTETFDVRLTRALLYRFDNEIQEDIHERMEAIECNIQDTVKEFISKQKSNDAAYSTLNEIIYNFEVEGISSKSGRFFYYLGEKYPEQSTLICQKILLDNSSSLCPYYGSIISGIMKSNKESAQKLVQDGIESQQNSIARSIAFGYSNGWGVGKIEKSDLDLIEELLHYPDDYVKERAILALGNFPESENQKIKTIALDLDIHDNFYFADALFKLFYPLTDSSKIELTPPEIEKMMMKLKTIPSLNIEVNGRGSYICNFFNYVAERYPEAILSLLLERVKYAIEIGDTSWNGYDAIPFAESFDCMEKFNEIPNYQNLLVKFFDEAYQLGKRSYSGLIFKILSNNYSPDAIQALEDWADFDMQEKISFACELIQNAPPEFLLDHSDFANKILESSSKISNTCHSKVRQKLFYIAQSGLRSGEFGEPYPIDVKIKNGAEECAKLFPQGTATVRFYTELAELAKGWINDEIICDEEL